MTAEPKTIVDGLTFPEGLRWRNGRLWFSDMHAGEVHTWSDAAGDSVIVRLEKGATSGLGWTDDGDLLVVSMDDRRVVRVDPDGGQHLHADLSGYTPDPINDMLVDHDTAYIGSFGFDFWAEAEPAAGVLTCVTPDGEHRIVAEEMLFPNGMALADFGHTLVVAETYGGRLTAFTRRGDGSLIDRRIWAQLPMGVLPDGICIDADGAIWLASPVTSECIRVVEGGDVVDRVPVGGRIALACTLGGHDGRTLFIATTNHDRRDEARAHRSGRIEAVTVEIEAP